MKNKKVFWCKTCLNMSTRNRIEFDEQGKCNACVWAEEKKTIDWSSREKELTRLLNRHKSKDSHDVIVPVSGGKDGSYVASKLRDEFGLNPLTVTSRPPLELDVGKKNLINFLKKNYDHIHVTANFEAMRKSRLPCITRIWVV